MGTAFKATNPVADAKADRKRRAAFYTPMPLVERLIEWADLYEGCSVLEPSAGDGRIVHALKAAGADVFACEIDETLHPAITDAGAIMLARDFLSLTPQAYAAPYSRIVMNPPFTRDAWKRHVEHAWTLLGPHGKLLAIVPTAVVSALAEQTLKLPGCNHATAEVLDGSLFAEFDTKVRVAVLELDRRCDTETLGFRNGATANAIMTIQNDRELLKLWVRDRDAGKRRALREIAEGGGSTYGIDWQEVTDHLADYQ